MKKHPTRRRPSRLVAGRRTDVTLSQDLAAAVVAAAQAAGLSRFWFMREAIVDLARGLATARPDAPVCSKCGRALPLGGLTAPFDAEPIRVRVPLQLDEVSGLALAYLAADHFAGNASRAVEAALLHRLNAPVTSGEAP